MSDDFAATRNIDWKKIGFLCLGIGRKRWIGSSNLSFTDFY
ncbi:hypothetical protein D1BOALGB6SA_4799 [Olavius sp. associated proteobacterium Delta 1]|nr:hypothetical protein D1BOALGB6SA_4799 [Olavius sp. associated proteobacterium Delta 1]